MLEKKKNAPGAPGAVPIWTTGAKCGVGKSIDSNSEVLFTISNGIINEVYYPREDKACVKDMQFLVGDGKEFFSEEKTSTYHEIKMPEEGIPAYQLVNKCKEDRYTIEKEILTDPFRNALLQLVTFRKTDPGDNLQLYALLCPHMQNNGRNNSAWIGEYKGAPMLFASYENAVLAMACTSPWMKRSVGFVGVSDGWQDLAQHKKMEWEYENAQNGNVALTGQIDLKGSDTFLIAIAFGTTEMEAANTALASLLDGFDRARQQYTIQWRSWLKEIAHKEQGSIGKYFQQSATVLRLMESTKFPGGLLASVAIPWGESRSEEGLGGYHVVWPRDLAESSGGFLSVQKHHDAMRIANYLLSTQEDNGRWVQNMWLAGSPYWKKTQMDQVALPVILIEKCYSLKLLSDKKMQRYWPRIKKAISFLARTGPYTELDRWEERSGLSPYTIATEITGLLAGAKLAEEHKEEKLAVYCRELADYWNGKIESWTYVTGTELAKEFDVDGYYIRINPFRGSAMELGDRKIDVRNTTVKLNEWICVDALSLVRFGLRATNDKRILNTLKLIDAKLKVETDHGDSWHRYTHDAYGEDENGNPFFEDSQQGIGRAWPLLTGERGHYEVSAGNKEEALKLLHAMESFSENGFISEQIWDSADIPEKGLYCGRPTGSAMPLTWAHAEYVKLCCSISEEKVFDLHDYTRKRYIDRKNEVGFEVWRFNWMIHQIPKGKKLRIELETEALVHWTTDKWETKQDTETTDTTIGLHIADIDPGESQQIFFTFYWKEVKKWEGKNFSLEIK